MKQNNNNKKMIIQKMKMIQIVKIKNWKKKNMKMMTCKMTRTIKNNKIKITIFTKNIVDYIMQTLF